MSVSGNRPETIEAVIRAGLTGTITEGTAGSTISFTLHVAEDDRDPTIGAGTTADGGYTLVCLGSRGTGSAAPSGTGGTVQRQRVLSWLLSVSYLVSGARGEALGTATTAIASSLLDLVEAALEPQLGANYNAQFVDIGRLYRPPDREMFYVQEINISAITHWSRT